MMQDHLGFFWFGIDDALVRYDGYQFKVYKIEGSKPSSTSVDEVTKIYEDSEGTIWVGANQGLLAVVNRFDRATETFKQYLIEPEDRSADRPNLVLDIFEDSRGRFWVGTQYGLILLDRMTDKIKRFYYQRQGFNPSVYEFLSGLESKGKTIASILHVGNNVNISKEFNLKKDTDILFASMGEENGDYGWIEDENGYAIINYNLDTAIYAGGTERNRIQLTHRKLHAGKYSIHFKSDREYSYNDWMGFAPPYPDFWGASVFSLEGITANLDSSISSTYYRKDDYQFIYTIAEDRMTGDILIGGIPGLWKLDEKNEVISQIPFSIFIYNIRAFYQLKDGSIIIATSRGLLRYNSDSKKIKIYRPVSTEDYIRENEFYGGLLEYGGLIYAGARSGDLVCFNPETEQFKIYNNDANDPFSLSPSSPIGILSLLKDNSGILWVSTSDFGLNKWDMNKTKFNSYKYDKDPKKSLGNNQVMSLIEDKEGTIWIGTYGGGLVKYKRNSKSFFHYRHNPGSINSLSDDYVLAICEDPEETGVFWIGTQNKGLNKFDSKLNTFKHFFHDPKEDHDSLGNNNIMFILPNGKEDLWICTYGGGLKKFNRKTEKWERYLNDKKTGKWRRFLNNPDDSTSISSNLVWYCYIDRLGTLWVGTINDLRGGGLNRYDYISQTFKSYYSSPDKSWDPSAVTFICEDKSGNFWVGDYDTGFYLFDCAKEEYLLNLTQKDGLSNNSVLAILEDNSGNLWISTYNGLSEYNPVSMTFRNFYEEDGLNSNKFFFRSAFKSRTGELFFGGENGFTWFYPEDIKDDPDPPLVAITNLSLFNRPDEKLDIDGFISEMDEIELPYNHNDLRFDYVGLHFGDPSKNKYKYLLDNFDEDWVDAGTQRNATYTNLDPGEYVFRVKAANHDGVWNEEGKSLRIIINHPYWATWWAYTFYFLFAIGLIYSLRKYEVNRLRLKNQVKLDEILLKEKEETNKMKSRFFANISHEFRTPLTLINGPIEKILSKHSDEETVKQAGLIKRNSIRLLELINQLLDLSKLEAGKLQLKASRGNIVSFVRGVTMSFESIAERKDILLKVKSDRDEVEVYFDRDMMAKVLSNLLSNAFKFTQEGGSLTVSILEKSDKSIELMVKDSGIGISEEELPKLFDRFYQVDSSQTREYEGSGLGLALTKELVELHRGTITAISKPGEGSEFIVDLPLGREHLNDNEIAEIAESVQERNFIDKSIYAGKTEAIEKSTGVIPGDDKYIILVVEDNAYVREYIKDSLGSSYHIEETINGEQGLRKAQHFIPDLIISDIMMPKMDGNELTRKIKNDERTSHIPIILLTAKSEQESRLEGLETGADDYLTKPFDVKELQLRIKNLITIRRNLQNKYSGEKIIIKKDEKKLRSIDEKFLNKVLEVVEKHLSEEEFSIEEFGEEVGMSRVQLHRKLKALTGKSASLYLRSVRLAKAKKMIEEKKGNISEIAYSVGFSSPAYFTACFKEKYGYPPSELKH